MIAIVDYGVGNLASVRNALAAVGARAELVRDPDALSAAGAIVLPGVGHFGHCSREFHRRGFAPALRVAREGGTPILAICVGMQLLFEGSEEAGDEPGLGLLPGRVRRMREVPRLPHVGWNEVRVRKAHPWLPPSTDGGFFYFVHSYAAGASGAEVLGTVDHGGERAAIVGSERLLGVQFHPERSGSAGLALLRTFAAAVGALDTKVAVP